MIFDPFIRRPRLSIVISILISLAGLIAMQVMPVAQYPDIAPPTVQVAANYSGADAETVEATVAQPIESAINGVDGMKYMKSTSSSAGSYSLSVAFAVGTDPDIAAVNVQNALSAAEAALPSEVRATGVTVTKQSNDMLQAMLFYSPNKTRDGLFISNFLTLTVLDELKRVPGVGNATMFGAQDYAMRIWIDPLRLANYELTTADVIAAVNSQNTQAAAGRVGAAPVSDDQSLQLTVTTRGRLSSVEEFQRIVLRATDDGALVTIADVARVELAAQSFDTTTYFNDSEASVIAIYLSPGANAVTVATAVEDKLEDLRSRFPDDVDFQFVFNTADFVEAMIEKVIETLFEAFVLVAVVVFVFLGRFRPTLIPLIAVPVAIVGALAVMYVFGYSANTITLLALVLAIGIVVDDAIIVVENVERVMHEEPDLPRAQVVSKAMAEIAGPVIAITLVLLSVFVPLMFIGGSSGRLFQQFAVAVSAAMVISAINALTLSPALCAVFLKPGKPLRVVAWMPRGVDWVGHGFARMVGRLSAVAVLSLVVIAAVAAGSVYLMRDLPSGFVPSEDKGYVMVIAQLPAGASVNRTRTVILDAVDAIEQNPAVIDAVGVVGLDLLGGGTASNAGVIFARLKPYAERTAPSMHAEAVLGQLYGALAADPGASFIPLNPPAISGIGQVGGFEYVLEALQGQEPGDMAAAMRGLIAQANQQPELSRVFSTFSAETPQVRLEIDRERAQTLQLRIQDIFQALQTTLGSYYINDFNLYGRAWTVQLQAETAYRDAIDDIGGIQIRNADGEMISLAAVARTSIDVGPRNLTRYNNYRAVSINGSPAEGFGDGDALNAMARVSEQALPQGYGYEWTGQALEQTEAAGQTAIVLGLAVMFAYLFLVALYESWTVPIAVLLSVAVAVLGALGTLWMLGMNFDLYGQIGIVVLIALASKNAILINAFALEKRGEGLSIRQSAMEAARLRFRPVMMTSLAFICGLVPLVLASGPGAGSMVAVGVPVMGGMIAASVLGVVLVPMLFVVFQTMRERVHRMGD